MTLPQEGVSIARISSLYEVDDERFVTVYYLYKPHWVQPFIRHLLKMGSLPWLEWVSEVQEETDSILIGFNEKERTIWGSTLL